MTPVRSIAGLDAIRFVCAIWVAFAHVGLPRAPEGLGALGWVYGHALNGAAAVAAFFVISGLCIHHPHAAAGVPHWGAYFVRRYVRIVAPLLAAVGLAWVAGLSLKAFAHGILWSLFAELIYYTLYPFFLAARRRVGWNALVAAATVASVAVAAAWPATPSMPAYGVGLTWLVALPSWLLGCRLAELPPVAAPGTAGIWAWRLGVWAASVGGLWVHFFTPVKLPVYLIPFGFLVAAWVRREIARADAVAPPAWLEWAGAWSYSLYLVHLPTVMLLGLVVPDVRFVRWPLNAALMLLGCYLFYRAFERPAHGLARRLAARLRDGAQGPNEHRAPVVVGIEP